MQSAERAPRLVTAKVTGLVTAEVTAEVTAMVTAEVMAEVTAMVTAEVTAEVTAQSFLAATVEDPEGRRHLWPTAPSESEPAEASDSDPVLCAKRTLTARTDPRQRPKGLQHLGAALTSRSRQREPGGPRGLGAAGAGRSQGFGAALARGLAFRT